MTKKLMISVGMALALIAIQVGVVIAAPAAQEATPITGTVQAITLDSNPITGETTVLVSLLDETGGSQAIRLTVDYALTLRLVTTDPTTGEPIVNSDVICTAGEICNPISIDPEFVLGEESDGGFQHPVALVLASFFGEDYETIMETHEEGVGFGVIAQALWMSNQLGGSSDTFEMIVEAKQNGDYSGITLPDGSTPQNWGQFKKAVQEKGQNLGSVMSGPADPLEVAPENENPAEDGTDQETATEEGTVTTDTIESNNENNNGQGNSQHGNNGRGRGHGKNKK